MNRKFLRFTTVVLGIGMLLSSCGGSSEDATPSPTPVVENIYKPIVQDVDINMTHSEGNYSINYGTKTTCEIDGQRYDIDIKLDGKDEYDFYHTLDVKINDAAYQTANLYCYGLTNIKLMSFKDDGNIYITNGISLDNGWVEEYCYRFDGTNITQLNFKTGGVDVDVLSISNTCDFEVREITNEGFTFLQKTQSTGMWNLLRTVKIEGDNGTVVAEESYDVDCVGFLTPSDDPYYSYDNLLELGYVGSQEEYDMLSQGYAMCHADHEDLKQGDYFTILKDDGNDTITIQVKDGEQFDMNVGSSFKYDDREAISHLLFYLAG